MVSSFWANDKAVWHLDDWRERAELDCGEPNFLEVEFDSVIVEIEILQVADSSSGADLFLNILLNWGDVHEPEVIRVAE
jgi:hypothetical protein